jgi:hypothetical protein
MQMRQGLTQSESDLVRVHLAFEQHRQDIIGGQTCRWTRGHDVLQPFSMVVLELGDALMQSSEGLAMRGQDQAISGQVGELVQ